jgi:hypothetical protein
LLTGMAMVEPGMTLVCGCLVTTRPLGEKWFPRLLGERSACRNKESESVEREKLREESTADGEFQEVKIHGRVA